MFHNYSPSKAKTEAKTNKTLFKKMQNQKTPELSFTSFIHIGPIGLNQSAPL